MRWKCVVMCQVYMCERVMVYVDVAVWTCVGWCTCIL